jgi:hypothetical protein
VACASGFGCGQKNYVVGYWDFQPVNTANYWVFIGQTPTHQDNHWGRVPAINAMQGVAVQYRSEYPSNPVIGLNDVSLIRGGVFDLGPQYGGVYWQPPHHQHDWGTAFDVRGDDSKPNSIPEDPAVQDRFQLICIGFGASEVHHESPGTGNEHFHCEWPH